MDFGKKGGGTKIYNPYTEDVKKKGTKQPANFMREEHKNTLLHEKVFVRRMQGHRKKWENGTCNLGGGPPEKDVREGEPANEK